MKDVAMISLAKISNEAALNVLAKQITPDNTKQNVEIANNLGAFGNQLAADFLKKYATDPQYKDSRADFEQAIKNITTRLEQEQKSQPSTKPASTSAPASQPSL